MAMVIDPVCGMRIQADDAAATAEYDGQTYYFCSQACHDVFVADPSVFGARSLTGTGSDHLTEEEVAHRAGMTPERLRELVDLGLLARSSIFAPKKEDLRPPLRWLE